MSEDLDDREQLLVHADWLESQGHPRGELIAVQDVEQRCTSVAEFEQARARSIELVCSHPELAPASADARLWAVWRGGFIRRVELFIDQPAPYPGAGLRGWSAVLAELLGHPSLALVEQIVVRVDLRGEPLDEARATLDVIREGFSATRPRSRASVTLWTSKVPTQAQREQLAATLPGFQTRWMSSDMTLVPPSPDGPTTALEHAIARLPDDHGPLDLVWFDASGRFRDLWRVVPHAVEWAGPVDPSVRLLVEHATFTDPLGPRRITNVLDAIAARLDPQIRERSPLAPRSLIKIRPIEEPLDPLGLGSVLARFALDWWSIEDEPDRLLRRKGVCGLGDAEFLLLMWPA